MSKFCTDQFESCTCFICSERRYHAELARQAKADLAERALAEEAARARATQLRLPMSGLAHCADQSASLHPEISS